MRHGERGQALIATIVGLSLVLLVLLATLTFSQFSGKLTARQLTFQGQALNASEAGLTEALSWFRTQAVQPVTNFAPVQASGQTENQAIGIVRTFQVSGPPKLKGRYEVRIGNLAAGTGTIDVTARRGNTAGPGTIWQLESTGYVYVDNGAATFNQSPNQVIAKRTMRTEIQKLAVTLPGGNTAIFSRKANLITISGQGTVRGGSGVGLSYPRYYAQATGTPTTNGKVTGSPAQSQVDYGNPSDSTWTATNYPWNINGVFGVSQQELITSADVVVTQVSDLPYQGTPPSLPDMSLIVVNGNATFDVTRPLSGSGIIVILGDCVVSANSNSSFNGLVYVTGNITINSPANISGAVVAGTGTTGGTVVLQGTGDVPEVDFDDAQLDQIRQQMGQYRFSRGSYLVGR